VQNSTFTNNTSAALFGYNIAGLVVDHSRLSNNTVGSVAIESGDITIKDTNLKNNTYSIEVIQDSNITIQKCYT
jgi:hypothetical protein